MAIEPLTAPYKTLTFDGETSASFGVQILGKGTFNAPKRDVKMISVPGRSGELALDNGRFENIKVKYPARLIANSTDDFADAISEFRNFLCSRKGYCRLTDDYNPDEYRMAVYKEGLDVDVDVLKAGKFDITFDCKPQRWLTSGETAIEVTSGDTITNPTLFEAGPLLEVDGYGKIDFNGYEIELHNSTLGEVRLSPFTVFPSWGSTPKTITFDVSNLLSGDRIYVKESTTELQYIYAPSTGSVSTATLTSSTNMESAYATYSGAALLHMFIDPSVLTFTYGTSGSVTATAAWSVTDVNSVTGTVSVSITMSYDGDDTLTISISTTISRGTGSWYNNKFAAFYGDSSVAVLLSTTYIDLDIGEAYGILNGVAVSVNSAVDLPADLPKLAPGSNTITYDNTFTSVKVTPRWWIV